VLNKLSVVYNNRSITLNDITTVAILGDNGVGKTSLLERIALVSERNVPEILNVKGSFSYEKFVVSIDDEEVECERVDGSRIRVSQYVEPNGILVPIPFEIHHRYCKGITNYKVVIVYPYSFRTPTHEPHYNTFVKPNEESVKFNDMVKELVGELVNGIIIPTAGDFVYEDNDNVKYLDSLGRGISNTVKLAWIMYKYKPDILLIDDIETLGLNPKRLQTFFKWVLQYIQSDKLKAMLFTTNSDAYIDLAEVDEKSKFLILQRNDHLILDREEVLDRLDYEDLRYTALKNFT